jgi:hypothetical protein
VGARITRDVIESNLHCRLKAHLKPAGNEGIRSDYELVIRPSPPLVVRFRVAECKR